MSDTVIPNFCPPDIDRLIVGCIYGPRWDIAKAFGWPPGVRLERVYTDVDGQTHEVKDDA